MAEIRCPLFESAQISKHEAAAIHGDRTLLYFEYDELANCAAAHLRRAGVGEGTRVALLLAPDWKYLVLVMGLLRIRAVACPLNARMPAGVLRQQLSEIDCKLVIARAPEAALLGGGGLTVLDPDEMARHSDAFMDFDWNEHFVVDQPATILFTSGSMGRPKAVLHTFGNHYYSARGSNVNIRVRSRDRWLLSLPLYHVGGLGILFRCILGGATIAVPQEDESIEDAQEKYSATHLSLVTTQLYRLLHLKRLPDSFTSIKAILLGGSAVNPALLKSAYDRHLPIFASYGTTEMASQITTMRPDSPPPKRFTSGKALNYAQVRIAADGEILVRGNCRFAGYVEHEQLVKPFDAEGWFSTGDVGSLDAEGYLTVVGRKDNMFISGGENIHPEQIERALGAFEDVEEALVVPVPHAEFGHRPVAFLKMRRDPLATEAWVLRLEKIMPRYMIPDVFLDWPAAAGNGMKPDRAAFRAMALELRATG